MKLLKRLLEYGGISCQYTTGLETAEEHSAKRRKCEVQNDSKTPNHGNGNGNDNDNDNDSNGDGSHSVLTSSPPSIASSDGCVSSSSPSPPSSSSSSSWLLSSPHEDGCLAHTVFKFLDPGLDFPSCRLVHPVWNEWVEYFLAMSSEETNIWMSRLQIHDTAEDYHDRLRKDLGMVRETTVAERERYIQETKEDKANSEGSNAEGAGDLDAEDNSDNVDGNATKDTFEIKPHHLWRRTDVVPGRQGQCPMTDWSGRRHLVSARIVLNVRNAYRLIEFKYGIRSEMFQFAGRWYYFCVGTGRFGAGTSNTVFGIELLECCNEGKNNCWTVGDPQRRDPTRFETKTEGLFPSLIRYRTYFKAAAGTYRPLEMTAAMPEGFPYWPSGTNGNARMSYEYIPLSSAGLALGPAPSCPHLQITIELEHLGFAYCQ